MGCYLCDNKNISHGINIKNAVISATNAIKRKQHNKKHGYYVNGSREAIYNLLLSITDNILYLSYSYIEHNNVPMGILPIIHQLFITTYGRSIRYKNNFDNHKIINYYAMSFLNKNDIAYDLNKSAVQGSRILRSKDKFTWRINQKNIGRACIIYLWHVIEYRPQIKNNKLSINKHNIPAVKQCLYGKAHKPQKVVSKYDYLRFIANSYRYHLTKYGYSKPIINDLRKHSTKTDLIISAMNMRTKLYSAIDEIKLLHKLIESRIDDWNMRGRMGDLAFDMDKIEFCTYHYYYRGDLREILDINNRYKMPERQKKLEKLGKKLDAIDNNTGDLYNQIEYEHDHRTKKVYLLYQNDIIRWKVNKNNNVSKLFKQALIRENSKRNKSKLKIFPNWCNMIDIPLTDREKDPFRQNNRVISDQPAPKDIQYMDRRPFNEIGDNPVFKNATPSHIIYNVNSVSASNSASVSASASISTSSVISSYSASISESKYESIDSSNMYQQYHIHTNDINDTNMFSNLMKIRKIDKSKKASSANFSTSLMKSNSDKASKNKSKSVSISASRSSMSTKNSIDKAIATNSVASLSYYHHHIYSAVINSLNGSLSASASSSYSLSNSISKSASESKSASMSESVSISQSISSSASTSKSAFFSNKVSDFQRKNSVSVSSLAQSLAKNIKLSDRNNSKSFNDSNTSISDDGLPF